MKAYCINLQQRADRWQSVQPELAILGFNEVERVEGIWNDVGHQGCIDSHIKTLRIAKDYEIFAVLIPGTKGIGVSLYDSLSLFGRPPFNIIVGHYSCLNLSKTVPEPSHRQL